MEHRQSATCSENNSNVSVESCNWLHVIHVVFRREKTVCWKTADGKHTQYASQSGVREYPVAWSVGW